VGLKWGGWETKSSAQALAQQQVNATLVKVTHADLHDQFPDGCECTDEARGTKKIGTSAYRRAVLATA
jgi:hypothetical protein